MAKLLQAGSCAAGLSWPRIGPFLEAPDELQAPLRLHIADDNDPPYDTIPINTFGILPVISDWECGLLRLGE
jgi:hypothetical protein